MNQKHIGRERSLSCGPDVVARWADLARDHNPLHLDPAFAAGTRFGVPIVHGHLLACLLLDEIQMALGSALVDGGQVAIRFRAPVPVGDQVTISLTGTAVPPVVRVRTGDVDVLEVTVAPSHPDRSEERPT